MENFDVSSLPEEVLQNIEADSYWCMSKLLDGIQVNWFFLSVSSGVNWLMSWLWITLRLKKSTSMKNRGEVDFLIGETHCEFGIERKKKICVTSLHQNVCMFYCVWCSRAEQKPPVLDTSFANLLPSMKNSCSRSHWSGKNLAYLLIFKLLI